MLKPRQLLNMNTEIANFNNLLGTELGRRPDGHPIFAWKNSDALFWPAFKTGRTIVRKVEVSVPIIGGGTENVVIEMPTSEYRRDRQMRSRDTWVVTKWLSPEDLIYGTDSPHGKVRGTFDTVDRPTVSRETVIALWSERNPGAPFPAAGWRIPTNATLPARDGGPREPNWIDTEWFIACVKEQTRLGFQERLQEQYDGKDAVDAAIDRTIGDVICDCFPAFLNDNPGKRGGSVSFPFWAKRDRL